MPGAYCAKQTQFPPEEQDGQVLCRKGVMVNRTSDGHRQNKANFGGWDTVGPSARPEALTMPPVAPGLRGPIAPNKPNLPRTDRHGRPLAGPRALPSPRTIAANKPNFPTGRRDGQVLGGKRVMEDSVCQEARRNKANCPKRGTEAVSARTAPAASRQGRLYKQSQLAGADRAEQSQFLDCGLRISDCGLRETKPMWRSPAAIRGPIAQNKPNVRQGQLRKTNPICGNRPERESAVQTNPIQPARRASRVPGRGERAKRSQFRGVRPGPKDQTCETKPISQHGPSYKTNPIPRIEPKRWRWNPLPYAGGTRAIPASCLQRRGLVDWYIVTPVTDRPWSSRLCSWQ